MADNKEEIVLPKLADFIEEEPKEEVVVEEKVEEVKADPIVEKAREMGWVPEEEFEGDPDTWIPAKEFVGRKPLYDAIHKANRSIKQMEAVIEASKKFNGMLAENAKKQALAELQDKLDAAAANYDFKEVIKIQKEIDKQEEVVEEEKNEALPPEEVKKTFDGWLEKNKWYEDDRKMRHVATGYGQDIKAENPEIEFTELLEKVTEKIKQDFPEKFSNPAKKRAPAVTQPPTRGKSEGVKFSIDKLPAQVQDVYRQLVKTPRNPHGYMDHDTWLKEYIASGGTLEN